LNVSGGDLSLILTSRIKFHHENLYRPAGVTRRVFFWRDQDAATLPDGADLTKDWTGVELRGQDDRPMDLEVARATFLGIQGVARR
jgi:hypothetical protein